MTTTTKALALSLLLATTLAAAQYIVPGRPPAAPVGSQSFSEDFSGSLSNWSHSGWSISSEQLNSPSGEAAAVYTAGQTDTATQCVCIDLDITPSIPGIGLRMSSTYNGGYHYAVGSYLSVIYVWEFNGNSWSADIYESAAVFGPASGDRLCARVSGTGAGTVFRAWLYASGADGGAECTGTCSVGNSGSGCTNSWDSGSGPTGNVSDSNKYCGVVAQQAMTYDNWTCKDN